MEEENKPFFHSLEVDQAGVITKFQESVSSVENHEFHLGAENFQTGDNINTEKLSEFDEKQLFRKISTRILPILFSMICFCYVDRTNLSFASLSLIEDLNLTCAIYGLGSGIFFVGYSMFQIPSNLILVRVGAPVWLGTIVCGWGILAASFAAVKTSAGFVVLRFFLGVLEAGAFPGMWYYLTLLYPKDKISVPFSIVETAIPFSQVIGAPLASGILALEGVGGLAGWQWLFITEGIPSIVIGLLIFFKLPKDVYKITFLEQTQKQWLVRKVSAQRSGEGRSNLEMLKLTLQNGKVWYIAAANFCRNLSVFGVIFWLPVIIYSMIHENDAAEGLGRKCGGSKLQDEDNSKKIITILLTSIPYTLAALVTLFNGFHAQMKGENRLHGGLPYFLGGVAFMFFSLFASINDLLGFMVLTITVIGSHAPSPILLNLMCIHADNQILPVALPLFNAVGQIGSFLGPFIIGVVLEYTGSYTPATIFVGSLLMLAGILLLILKDPPSKYKKRSEIQLSG